MKSASYMKAFLEEEIKRTQEVIQGWEATNNHRSQPVQMIQRELKYHNGKLFALEYVLQELLGNTQPDEGYKP